jgi:hypothetical protein
MSSAVISKIFGRIFFLPAANTDACLQASSAAPNPIVLKK